MALQTRKQREANAQFEKKVTKSWGKKRAAANKTEFPLSKPWIIVLVFLVCGGAILELIRMFF
ncbi:protein Ysy6p [Diutina rugosa]